MRAYDEDGRRYTCPPPRVGRDASTDEYLPDEHDDGHARDRACRAWLIATGQLRPSADVHTESEWMRAQPCFALDATGRAAAAQLVAEWVTAEERRRAKAAEKRGETCTE